MAHHTDNRLLAVLQQLPGRRDQLVHVERIPARPARYADPPPALNPRLAAALGRRGIARLYAHQAAALEAARAGAHLAVVTATASGKTLCYQLPAIEALLAEPDARALLLFPTKALAHDQLRSLERLLEDLPGIAAATFDGDTPPAQRQAVRSSVQLLLSNPDMLHRTLLPGHRQWAGWLARLRYVVLDEAHIYRGVFGTHVALVVRRLLRLCAHYGSAPQLICCSATSANPQEHLSALVGAPVALIDGDGAPQGPRAFAFWNPPPIERAGPGGEAAGRRRSTNIETAGLFGALVRAGVKTLAFARSRRGAELVLRYARESMEADGGQRMLSRLTGAPAPEARPAQIAAYRAGYAPGERRRLEAAFLGGELRGLVSTNALELGVDIGGVDAVVIGGFPGTVASTWQQAGRGGRSQGESLAVLVAQDDPLDQFYMRHPREFFSRPHEHARVALDNPYILRDQLRCAAAELPLHDADALWFGPTFAALRDWQLRHGELAPLDDGRAVSADERPAAAVNIRSADGEPVTLRDSESGRMIEQISASRAPFEVYPGAVYLHQGDSYLVASLEARRAEARRTAVNYYTQPISETEIAVEKVRETRKVGPAALSLGVVEVTNRVTGYRRKEHYSEAVLGEHELSLPPLTFRTLAVWWTVPEALCRQAEAAAGCEVGDALHAFEHACIGLLPLFAQCDRADIGGVSTALHAGTGMATVFVYDGVPGGVGISQVGYEQAEAWWRQTDALLQDCPCAEGCPACIQSPKCGNGNQHLSKGGARALGALLLGRQPPGRGPRLEIADSAAPASADTLLDDLRGRVERARGTPRGPRRAALLVALRYRLRTERGRLGDPGQQAALDAIEAEAAALD